jgi:N-alpha-acetyltransferase 10/11
MCLAENYRLSYYLYQILAWPQISTVAEDSGGRIVGYVLAQMNDDAEGEQGDPHGHILSVAVLKTHRKLGLATRLMQAAEKAMVDVYDGERLTLHVRRTNTAALHLYQQTLGFRVHHIETGYYANGEDGLEMCKRLSPDTRD